MPFATDLCSQAVTYLILISIVLLQHSPKFIMTDPQFVLHFILCPQVARFPTVLNTKVRQKFTSTFALFRGNVHFQFLQRSDVNRRTAVGKLLLLCRSIMRDVVSKLPAGRLRCLTGLRFFFSFKRPDLLWGPSSLLFNEYPGFCPRGQSCRRVCS